MNISPINNYNNSTNFTALKIDPKLAQKLESKTPEYINKLSNIGESIKDVKRFHVVLDDSFSLTPKVLADNTPKYGHRDYYHELKHKIEPYLGKPYYATAGDETVSGINPDIPQIFSDIYNKESRVAKYDEFCKLGELDQAAEYSKLLDEAIAIKE